MKNKNNLNQSSQDCKDKHQLLIAIKELIKTSSLREEGFSKLLKVDASALSIKNEVLYYYIKGKYFLLKFKEEDKDIELLNIANDCYNDMAEIAFTNKFSIKNPKFHFARAYCKYLIAQHLSSEEAKGKLIRKVEQITGRILRYQPENSSFLWLQKQIEL